MFKADELKVVHDPYTCDPEYYLKYLQRRIPNLYLQPMSGTAESIQETLTYVKENPQWRISLQTQKLIQIQ